MSMSMSMLTNVSDMTAFMRMAVDSLMNDDLNLKPAHTSTFSKEQITSNKVCSFRRDTAFFGDKERCSSRILYQPKPSSSSSKNANANANGHVLNNPFSATASAAKRLCACGHRAPQALCQVQSDYARSRWNMMYDGMKGPALNSNQ